MEQENLKYREATDGIPTEDISTESSNEADSDGAIPVSCDTDDGKCMGDDQRNSAEMTEQEIEEHEAFDREWS